MSTLPVSPHRATYFSSRGKVGKTLAPDIRPRLRRGSLTPSLLRGLAAKGHSWPIASLAASMPLNPLRNDSVRPPEGGVWSCLKVLHSFLGGSHAPRGNPSRRNARSTKKNHQAPRSPSPRQEAEWRCCAGGREAGRRARNEGTGMSLRDGPRSGTGRREVRAQPGPGCRGVFSFAYFSLHEQRKVRRPGGRNQRPRGSQEVGQTSKAHASTLSTASTNTRGEASSISRVAISTATCTLLPRVIRSPVATSVIR